MPSTTHPAPENGVASVSSRGRLSPSAIVIRGLQKRYPKTPTPALDGIDLRVEAGETFGLLGPNGAGKSTTVGICTTRVRPSAGSVVVAGWDVVKYGVAVRRDIGVVTQSNTLDRSCSVAENLYFHCRFFGMSATASRARMGELLESFSLLSRAGAPPRALSGGMVQRLQIARAIAHRPAVLFLDEPTAGLDPQSRLALWDQLDQLRADGTTIFLTTHYMEEADKLCDRVAVMDQGRILAIGSAHTLKRQCATGTIVEVVATRPSPQVRDQLRCLNGVHHVQETSTGYRITTSGSQQTVSRIVAAAGDIDVRGLTITEPSLETVFLELTGKALRD